MLACIMSVLICSLLPAWVAMRLVHRYRDRSAAFFLGFVVQFVLAVATAWLVGIGFDILGVPMYAPPPKPGNFTLPIPWTYLLPMTQEITFGPATGLVVGVWAKVGQATRHEHFPDSHRRHDG